MNILKRVAIGACLSTACFATLYTSPSFGDETKVEVTDADAIKLGLEKLSGKSVTLRLSGGEDVSGVVEAVGPSAVRIGQLTGKEFYSAIVTLADITAVIYRAK